MQPKKNSPPAGQGKTMKTVALVLVVGAAVAFTIFRMRREPSPEVDTKRAANIKGVFAGGVTKTKVNSKPAESRGTYAADEMMQLVGKAGTVAIVMEIPDPNMPGNSDMVRFFNMIEAEIETFKEHLQDKGTFTFLPELKLVRPEGATQTVWPAGTFSQLLQRTPPQAVIVAFCYLPTQINDGEKTVLRSRPGKLVISAGSEPEMKPLVAQKLAHLVITSKSPIPPPTGTEPETPTQWLMRVHTVLKQ